MASLYNTWLIKELEDTLTLVDGSIEEVKKEADKIGSNAQTLRNMNGDFIMIPLLSARAAILTSLTALQS